MTDIPDDARKPERVVVSDVDLTDELVYDRFEEDTGCHVWRLVIPAAMVPNDDGSHVWRPRMSIGVLPGHTAIEIAAEHPDTDLVSATVVWFLATCLDCMPPMPQPFTSPADRDVWVTAHKEGTGHDVYLSEQRRHV